MLSVIYSLFGAVQYVKKSRYKIDLTLDFVNVGVNGFDSLGSWIEERKDGLIISFYPLLKKLESEYSKYI